MQCVNIVEVKEDWLPNNMVAGKMFLHRRSNNGNHLFLIDGVWKNIFDGHEKLVYRWREITFERHFALLDTVYVKNNREASEVRSEAFSAKESGECSKWKINLNELEYIRPYRSVRVNVDDLLLGLGELDLVEDGELKEQVSNEDLSALGNIFTACLYGGEHLSVSFLNRNSIVLQDYGKEFAAYVVGGNLLSVVESVESACYIYLKAREFLSDANGDHVSINVWNGSSHLIKRVRSTRMLLSINLTTNELNDFLRTSVTEVLYHVKHSAFLLCEEAGNLSDSEKEKEALNVLRAVIVAPVFSDRRILEFKESLNVLRSSETPIIKEYAKQIEEVSAEFLDSKDNTTQ